MFREALVVTVMALLTAAAGAQGAPAPHPWLQAQVSGQSAFDSNIRQNNQLPLAGWEQDIDATLAVTQQGSRGGWSLRYQPFLQFFTTMSSLNSVNQTAALDAHWEPAPHWRLTGQMTGGDWEELTAEQLTAPTLAPAGAPPNAILPRTRAVSGSGQLQLAYVLSPKASLAAFGGYSERRFPGAATVSASLDGVRGTDNGLVFAYTTSPRTQWGVRVEEKNFSVGTASHLAAESATLSWTYAWTPVTSTTLYAGPEYSQVHATFALVLAGLPLTDRMYRARTYPRYGASITHSSVTVPWTVQVNQEISNGGGALPFPVSLTQAQAQLAPRLPRHWHLRLGARAAQFSALTTGLLASHVRMGAADVELGHPLGRQLSLDFDVAYLAQRSQGLMPLTPAVNRGLYGVRLTWQWPPREMNATP